MIDNHDKFGIRNSFRNVIISERKYLERTNGFYISMVENSLSPKQLSKLNSDQYKMKENDSREIDEIIHKVLMPKLLALNQKIAIFETNPQLYQSPQNLMQFVQIKQQKYAVTQQIKQYQSIYSTDTLLTQNKQSHPDEVQTPKIFKCNDNVRSCQCIVRTLKTLKSYQTLNDIIDNNMVTGEASIIKLCHQKHPSLLDDYIHIVTQHREHLDEVFEVMTTQFGTVSCNIMNCSLAKRYCRDRKKQIIIDNKDEMFIFYRDTLDQIHCYLYHMYDVGFRIKSKHVKHDANTNYNNNKSHAQNLVGSSQMFDNFQSRNNKFIIHDNTDDVISDESIDSITFVDALHEYIIENDGNHHELSNLDIIIRDEEYDSDAIKHDIGTNQEQSNIAAIFSDVNYQLAKKYIRYTRFHDFSFDIGYIFYYWDYYKKSRTQEQYMSFYFPGNENDHSGYLPHELYVSLKYKSLKQDITQNKLFSLGLHGYQISFNKARQYWYTNKAKQIKALNDEFLTDPLYYDIQNGEPLSLQNILSVVLYCDWTELSSELTKTFRKLTSFESLNSVKRRNREYSNWSKILRETVEYFGCSGWNYNKNDDWNKNQNNERGPFFCGMSLMVIPQFNIRLCSPTSTTVRQSVAERFGGSYGIIIQLNNNGGNGMKYLRCWDCSWLSNYNAEDERLFVGGHVPIRIESITHMQTNENFYDYFNALFYFDCMVTGRSVDPKTFNKSDITNEDYLILTNLIKHALCINGFKNKYPTYINDTFEQFVNRKKQINFNLSDVDSVYSKLQDLIMYHISCDQPKLQQLSDLNVCLNENNNLHVNNLFRSILFKLFKNVTDITIHSTKWIFQKGQQEEYIINILALLNLIKQSSTTPKHDIKIIIKAAHHYCWDPIPNDIDNLQPILRYLDVSWIGELYNSPLWNRIKLIYNQNHCTISLIQTKSKWKGVVPIYEDWLIINVDWNESRILDLMRMNQHNKAYNHAIKYQKGAKAIFKLAEYYLTDVYSEKAHELMKLLTYEQLKENNLCDKAANYYHEIGDNDASVELWKLYYSQLYDASDYKIHIDYIYLYYDLGNIKSATVQALKTLSLMKHVERKLWTLSRFDMDNSMKILSLFNEDQLQHLGLLIDAAECYQYNGEFDKAVVFYWLYVEQHRNDPNFESVKQRILNNISTAMLLVVEPALNGFYQNIKKQKQYNFSYLTPLKVVQLLFELCPDNGLYCVYLSHIYNDLHKHNKSTKYALKAIESGNCSEYEEELLVVIAKNIFHANNLPKEMKQRIQVLASAKFNTHTMLIYHHPRGNHNIYTDTPGRLQPNSSDVIAACTILLYYLKCNQLVEALDLFITCNDFLRPNDENMLLHCLFIYANILYGKNSYSESKSKCKEIMNHHNYMKYPYKDRVQELFIQCCVSLASVHIPMVQLYIEYMDHILTQSNLMELQKKRKSVKRSNCRNKYKKFKVVKISKTYRNNKRKYKYHRW
eukprot:184476_1